MSDTAQTFGMKNESKLGAATSRAQDAAEATYDKAKDMASDAVDISVRTARQADDYVRNIIEERPYTVAFTALAIGFLLGRMGRD